MDISVCTCIGLSNFNMCVWTGKSPFTKRSGEVIGRFYVSGGLILSAPGQQGANLWTQQ